MDIDCVVVGAERTNCFLLCDADDVVIVDPGDNADSIIEHLAGRKPSKIVLTHRHWDHLYAANVIRDTYGSQVYVSELDADAVQDSGVNGNMTDIEVSKGTIPCSCKLAAPEHRVKEGDLIACGNCKLRVIETPGHTAGSISLYEEGSRSLFTGDTLFAHGLFGNTDAPSGSSRDMARTWSRKFQGIPDDAKLYPGHGDFSTLGDERALNPNIA